MKGRVFNIKRFAVHDGPGIRVTVFLKGCPLRCWWCHNPEAVLPDGCEIEKVLKLNGNEHTIIEQIDREMSVNEVMKAIRKEQVFMDTSGGGVTFSGGEPFMQPHFLFGLLKACKLEGIHIAVDTSGYVESRVLVESFPLVDLFLFDLKLINSREHLKYTGKSNHLILKNLQLISRNGNAFRIRIPIIPEINTSSQHIDDFIRVIESLPVPPEGIDLLPYNKIGTSKYERFGIENKMTGSREPDEDEITRFRESLGKLDLEISVGG